MDSRYSLPSLSDISPSLLSFLSENFQNRDDLLKAPDLVSKLQKQCSDLDHNLSGLNHKLEKSIVSFASHSEQLGSLFNVVNLKLDHLKSSDFISGSSSDGRGGGGEDSGRVKHILGEELPALAKEVARVESVRVYAETALKLDSLVGDIEDAVSSTMTRNLRKPPPGTNSGETRLLAIKSLKLTEDILTSVAKSRPQWRRLVSSVDHRVDRALAVLRPQAIADHRSLLASLGWPPTLSNSRNVNIGKSSVVLNPLFTMQGDLKNQYCENFLALCSLQELQSRRKSRQLEGHYHEVAMRHPLWTIEELVNPISLASEHHFQKWVEKPEFIFALVYKITRDFVDSMDELLQPLVDEAGLVGYSCREEWISAMVTSLLMYLAKEIFPIYIGQLEEDSVNGVPSQARYSIMHLLDLMISFDKRVQSLVADSGVLNPITDNESFRRISTMSIFCDRPDWLELWAEMELGDTLRKLRLEMGNEQNWKSKVQGALLVSGSESYKFPAIAAAAFRHLSAMIDRCRPLPSISLRARFIRLACAPLIKEFLDCLLQKCQEAEGLTALADDDGLIKVANSVNAARYSESVMKDWSDDSFFFEMTLDQGGEAIVGVENTSGLGGGIFSEEIGKFEDFRKEWTEKISTVVLRGFDARCREYMKNKKQWQDKGEEGWNVSILFVGALDYLQGKISKLEEGLNDIDFSVAWRSLATGVDHLVFNGVLMSNAKFYNGGVERFGGDLDVLFGVFRAWCLRPERFFPKVSEGLKLLKMKEGQLKVGTGGMERWLEQKQMRHLGVSEAVKIVKNRVFKS
ncbi:hypothetical protein MKW94_009553 [Papaver nudicaule]|uniref:RINT1-like protein MAG2 n=1 Tax=Papaver nudicaule TaxID=74823 RepID=A0AA41SK10_PAPNU|nr:hypothetical protein [Papaver nudicaule]